MDTRDAPDTQTFSAEQGACTGSSCPNQHKKKMLIGAIVLSAIVICSIAVFLWFNVNSNPISYDQLRDDISGSDILQEGVLNSSYITPSEYSLVDIAEQNANREPGSKYGLDGNVLAVSFAATIQNESFTSTFQGKALYEKKQGWVFNRVEIAESDTTPLKGVDYSDYPQSSLTPEAVSDFESDLTEENGTYRSEARLSINEETWFSTVTTTYAQHFTFDSENGWTPSDSVSKSDSSNISKLPGKTFSGSQMLNLGDGYADFSLSITSENEDGTIEGVYTVNYHPNARETMTASSEVSGQIEYSTSSFTIIGQSDFNTTFSCQGYSYDEELIITIRRGGGWSAWPPWNDLNGSFNLREDS